MARPCGIPSGGGAAPARGMLSFAARTPYDGTGRACDAPPPGAVRPLLDHRIHIVAEHLTTRLNEGEKFP